MTQTQIQTGAASSASTSDHSEQKVCEYNFELVTIMVLGLG